MVGVVRIVRRYRQPTIAMLMDDLVDGRGRLAHYQAAIRNNRLGTDQMQRTLFRRRKPRDRIALMSC